LKEKYLLVQELRTKISPTARLRHKLCLVTSSHGIQNSSNEIFIISDVKDNFSKCVALRMGQKLRIRPAQTHKMFARRCHSHLASR